MIVSPRFHWVIVSLFLLKSNWNIWENYEWAMGDAASHYASGFKAILDFARIRVSWSPLNSLYFGAFGVITGDPFLATILHRIVIVLATTLLFFGILRKLLPGVVAMAMTFWWASIPTNIAPLYTVHLFAHFANLVPVFGFLLSKTERGRGISLALVAVSALFLRNEGVACYLFLSVCLTFFELWRRKSGKGITLGRFAGSYLAPSVFVFSIWALLAAQSNTGFMGSVEAIRHKSAFNFSQNYSFTYFLQHPETEGNVWYVYDEICERDFGKGCVSVGEAMRENPEAFMNHVKTNVQGIPASVEISFFNARHTERNPDVVTTEVHRFGALSGLVLLCLLWLIGGWLVYQDRAYFLERTFRPHIFAWLCFLGFFLQAIPVATIILARTSFYLTGIAFLYLLTGLCLWACWRRLPWSLPEKGGASIAGLVLVLMIPSLWANRTQPYDAPRAVLSAVDLLRDEMKSERMTLAASVYQTREVQKFLDPEERISVKGMEFLLPALSSEIPFGERLNQEGVDYFFACGEEVVSSPGYAEFSEMPAKWGWTLDSSGTCGLVQWTLYRVVDEASGIGAQRLNR